DARAAGQPLLLVDERRRPDPRCRHPRLGRAGLVGYGNGGEARAPDVGDVHHELRVLDRYRARRHADLRDPLPLPGAVADVDLPRGGGDDDLRRHDRWALPADPRRADVVRLLPPAVPEPAVPLAELP